MCRNYDVRTVEGELEKALYECHHIAPYNYGDLKKIGFNRATRTDKKVHGLQNVFSCKVHFEKGVELEDIRANINSKLPEDVKVFCILDVSNKFNAKINTSHRDYSYFLPSFMLSSIDELYLGSGGLTNKKPTT